MATHQQPLLLIDSVLVTLVCLPDDATEGGLKLALPLEWHLTHAQVSELCPQDTLHTFAITGPENRLINILMKVQSKDHFLT